MNNDKNDFLNQLYMELSETEKLEFLKQFYYQRYIIKEEDIPEKCYGQLSPEKRHDFAMKIINEQKQSFDKWFEFIFSEKSSYIPNWAKKWAFQGMLNLGIYDEQNRKKI